MPFISPLPHYLTQEISGTSHSLTTFPKQLLRRTSHVITAWFGRCAVCTGRLPCRSSSFHISSVLYPWEQLNAKARSETSLKLELEGRALHPPRPIISCAFWRAIQHDSLKLFVLLEVGAAGNELEDLSLRIRQAHGATA